MNYKKPSSLLKLTIKSLLRDENLAISSLRSLPGELFPSLFEEAYFERCWNILKALVQSWPFARLPLGDLREYPADEALKAILDGIDVLLQQEVLPRCKLRVLDLHFNGEKFWSVWTGVDDTVHSVRRQLVADRPSRNEKGRPSMEVCADLILGQCQDNHFCTYILKWIKKRKGVHLCCKKVTIYSLNRENVKLLQSISLCDVQELDINWIWTTPEPQKLWPFLGRMKNLRRLCLNINILDAIPSNELENQEHPITEFRSEFLQLLYLQQLYLESVSLFQGHLEKLLRSLQTQLEVFSLIDCTVTEGDLAHLFQSPHIRQLKELCLRGIPLTSVSEPLGALLEVNAATLQDLDLSLCGLQDPQLEALLPALSICSQLRSLNQHGNRLSMAILEKLLHCTTGLQHLCLQLFPAPLESSNPQGVPQSWVLDLLCTQISNILQHLGYSRSIMMSSCHCSHCARKEFRNWEPTFIPCSHLYETHYGELKAIIIPFRIIRSGI
ncbi:PRAME family member 7-like [Erinaceus europaeus]|uniref:PRAME family member 7-like n=1 Tax=Erinaceus europaeus TaxID=9365 RepID=A0ABM3Y7F2_ERIEU|nr:PRAME family member 7-like [Erinaceus europaeus]